MKLSYRMDGTGWATATIADAGREREMVVSYLSDSVLEMARAAIGLLEGAPSARFCFADEPGEHRCIVDRISDREARIRVLWFEELWSGLPSERGEEVFECTCTVARFCGEVLACLQSLLKEHGMDGYKSLWVLHDFPADELARLSQLVRARRMLEGEAS